MGKLNPHKKKSIIVKDIRQNVSKARESGKPDSHKKKLIMMRGTR